MVEIRKEVTKGIWTIIAPTRGERPFDYTGKSENKDAREESRDCPFCPGNEGDTPSEVYSIRDENSQTEFSWQVRVFPNKFPALDKEGTSSVIESDLFKTMGGFGFHEVVAETPLHDVRLEDLPVEDIKLIIQTYLERLSAFSEHPEIKYVSIFRNQGERAGASLTHPHSQIMATTFVPNLVRTEIERTSSFHRAKGSCIFCDLIEAEKREGKRIISENEGFVTISPFGARFPYETHLLPKKHQMGFQEITEEETSLLADELKKTLTALTGELGDFPYNLVIHTSPQTRTESETEEYTYHWHIEILPRLTIPAGFERGSENFINIVSPEDAAEALRGKID
ncbi:MAG: galactose-1-phosphate uridylyltransferase [Candidatus Bipolaricaulota bacterium]